MYPVACRFISNRNQLKPPFFFKDSGRKPASGGVLGIITLSIFAPTVDRGSEQQPVGCSPLGPTVAELPSRSVCAALSLPAIAHFSF